MQKLHSVLAWLKIPAVIVLLFSNIFRGLLGAVMAQTTVSYDSWPLNIKITIVVLVFVGIFVTSDICFFNTCFNTSALQSKLIATKLEETPVFKGKADVIALNIKNWNKKQEDIIKYYRTELRTENITRLIFGFISTFFASTYLILTKHPELNTVISQLSDAVTLVSTLFVLWYISSRLKDHKVDNAAKASSISEDALQKRLEIAAKHITAQTVDDTDVDFIEGTVSADYPFKGLIKKLRPIHGTTEKIYTLPQLFKMLQANTSALQQRIRRIVTRHFESKSHIAGDKGIIHYFVTKTEKGEYLISSYGFGDMFGEHMERLQTAITGLSPVVKAPVISHSTSLSDKASDRAKNETNDSHIDRPTGYHATIAHMTPESHATMVAEGA